MKSHGSQEAGDWKKRNTILVFKKGRKEDLETYKPVSLTFVPGKILEQILLGAMLRHRENGELIQHSPTKDRSCPSSPEAFCDRATTAADKEKSMDINCLEFCKAFFRVPQTSFSLNWRVTDLIDVLSCG